MPPTRARIIALLLLALAGAPGCGGSEEDEEELGVRSVTLLLPLAERTAETVSRARDVDIRVRSISAADAVASLCSGGAEVALPGRRLTRSERLVCDRNGIRPVRSLVAFQTVAIERTTDLDVECLTVEQLRRLWSAGSEIERYSGLGRGLPDRRVRLVAFTSGSAASNLFESEILGPRVALRKGAERVDDRTRFDRALASMPASIGFAPYDVLPRKDRPSPVAVDAGAGCVEPSAESVRSGAYRPLARPLFMYSTHAALERVAVERFVDLILDQPERAEEVGLVPRSPSTVPEAEPQR